jgi:hypothetical protein
LSSIRGSEGEDGVDMAGLSGRRRGDPPRFEEGRGS